MKKLYLLFFTIALTFKSFSLSQPIDYYTYIFNATNEQIGICDTKLKYCTELPSKEQHKKRGRGKPQDEIFTQGLKEGRTSIKICGKYVLLKDVILPVMKRKDGDKMIYQLIVPQEYYDRECGISLPSQSTE
jgi:hypothetical protein